MKVLIVGGTGVISSAVVDVAVEQGFEVTCINRGNNHGVVPNKKAHMIHFDVRNRPIADEKLRGVFYDVVVDFICFNSKQIKYSLDLFKDKCKQYVFISTDSVYKLQENGNYDENTPLSNPEWEYSYQKAECEDIVRDFCHKNKIYFTIVRPSITYGNTRIPYGFMPAYGFHYSLIERIKAGKPIICWNNGINKQTVMRVEDFAEGMVGLWGNEKAYNEAFGICGEVVSWSMILDAIEEVIGVKTIRVNLPVERIVRKLPSRRGEFLVDRAKDHCVSNAKLKKVVPTFHIKVPLIEGIKRTISYYEKNNKIKGVDYEYDGQCDMLLKGVCNHPNLKYVKYDEKGNLKQYYKGFYADSYFVLFLKFLKARLNYIIGKAN